MHIYERLAKEDLTEEERKIVDNVAEHGIHIVYVPGDDTEPDFAFTVGLYDRYEHPEVLVFDVPMDTANVALNGIADNVKEGAELEEGASYDDILQSPSQFKTISKSQYERYLGIARWYYGSNDFAAMQLVWSDQEGLFPWDDGFDEDMDDMQPHLWE